MPNFDPDFTKARASIRVFPKGDYTLLVKEGRPFAYIRESDGKEVGGCMYLIEMADGEFKGEQVTPIRVYVHTDKAWGMGKQFLLAAAGYNKNEEDQADEEFFSQQDFSVSGEGDDVQGGDGWGAVVGNLVTATLGTQMYEGAEQQTFKNWMPAQAATTA